jgi:S-adenosylmethionine:tRNA ribosyltransferase-isomerase
VSTSINDFRYDLPDDRIALYPLPVRDESKLLVYQKSGITNSEFNRIGSFLPESSFLFFNDTKVIPARILFTKETGATIEIFLLSPVLPSSDLAVTMGATNETTWMCTIGNVKRWPQGSKLKKDVGGLALVAELIDKEKSYVKLSWSTGQPFAEVIDVLGKTPLPPYLKRDVDPSDKERYQTIYSHHEGAVAAPTAGLHFTERVFNSLRERNIHHDFVTLHVSAGTFQPIKTDDPNDHVMHREQIVITRKNLDSLLSPDKKIIAVGTTSMRTLESLYWFGAKLIHNENETFDIKQNDPYDFPFTKPSRSEAFLQIRKWLDLKQVDQLPGQTSIFIKPGYRFNVCEGLITNFHQPGSTLILLVAAFIGDDWKKVYDTALRNNYRFLSYGDSSLLLPG